MTEMIALDIGRARTGIARASSAARLAEPLRSVPTDKLVQELKQIGDNTNVGTVVVGLPRNLSGDDTEQTKWVRAFVGSIKDNLGADFYWQDEALTSREAAGKLQNSKFKNQAYDEDAVAAAIILQDFLDSPETERQRC